MSLLRTIVPCAAALLVAAACSCSEEPAPAGSFSYYSGPPIDLLARKPDSVAELPGPIVPHGDSPGTVTWGASEGVGWSQTDHRFTDGTPYRETNQARAELVLSASRPERRELVLSLWCVRPAGDEPARASVTLNGIQLSPPEGLALSRGPALLRVEAPAPSWRPGTNVLELAVPLVQRDGRRAWDTLALASLDYGREARYVVDIETRTALFADGTGARYALELAGPARLEIEGVASGAGMLSVRTGAMDPRTGAVEMESGQPSAFFANEPGPLRDRLLLPSRAGAVRIVELEWRANDGGELALSKLQARDSLEKPRPPIVFVSIDTFAAQHLALYGYDRPTSPELARFAADAVVFERCLANAPWTLPSYLSVMSGLYPRAHSLGLEFQAGADIQPDDLWQLAENRWTLAEALRARGYVTGGFVDTLWLSPRYRVNQGFDNYNGDGAMAPFENTNAHIVRIVEELVPQWLKKTGGDRPPFLFLHALDAHGPYLPDAPFRDAFAGALEEGGTMVPAGSDNQTYRWMPWWMSRTLQPDEKIPEAAAVPLEEVVARYDESLLKVDAYLGKLFEHLRALGMYDDAVIVVTGDHGEHFGPGSFGHGMMFDSVLHVPLLLKLPANAHGGLRVKAPVALVDVYPTLLELAGVPPDPSRLHGTSLVARLDAPSAGDERVLYSEGGHVEQYALTQGCWRLVEERPGSESSEAALLSHPRVTDAWLGEHFPEILTRPLSKALLAELSGREGYSERIRELRALVAGPYYSLFDLCSDAGDRRDVAAEEPERLERMKVVLAAEKERSRAARAEARVSGYREPLSPEQREQLEEIGYGGGREDDGEDDADEKPAPPPGDAGAPPR